MSNEFESDYFSGKTSMLGKYDLKDWMHMTRYVRKEILEFKNSGKVLDVGCAYGYLLRFFDSLGTFETYGTDISKIAIKRAKKFTKARLKVSSAEKLPFKSNQFDLVTALQLVEHLPHPEKAIKEFYRVLNSGGIAYITTPNKYWFYNFLSLFSSKYKDRDITHISKKSIAKWRRLFKNAGFTIVRSYVEGFPGDRRVEKIFRFKISRFIPFFKTTVCIIAKK